MDILSLFYKHQYVDARGIVEKVESFNGSGFIIENKLYFNHKSAYRSLPSCFLKIPLPTNQRERELFLIAVNIVDDSDPIDCLNDTPIEHYTDYRLVLKKQELDTIKENQQESN